MDLKKLKLGETKVIANEKYHMDVLEEVDHKGKWGWEITDAHGDVVDSKYGYSSHDSADKDGAKELRKLEGGWSSSKSMKKDMDKYNSHPDHPHKPIK
jgi:hypothetical protein